MAAIFTKERLKQFAPRASIHLLEHFPAALGRLCPEFEIDTLLRRSHFLGQLHHESGGFSRLVENLNYSAERIPAVWPRLAPRAAVLAKNPEALANAAYGGKIGNGAEKSGDGWKYRGRGLIQLTGKDNYKERGKDAGLDLVGNPDQAADPVLAVLIACAFWKARGCNLLADGDELIEITKRINGPAMLGLNDRRALTDQAKRIFV